MRAWGPPPADTTATVAIVVAGILGVASIEVWGENHDRVSELLIVSLLVPTVTSLLAARKAEQARNRTEDLHNKVDEVKVAVNHRLEELLAQAAFTAYQEGITAERDRRDRLDQGR